MNEGYHVTKTGVKKNQTCILIIALNSYHHFRNSIEVPVTQPDTQQPDPPPRGQSSNHQWSNINNNQQQSNKNWQRTRANGNRDHRQDHRRQGRECSGASNHCGLPPALANDIWWAVSNISNIIRVDLPLLSDGRCIYKSWTIIDHAYPNDSNFTRVFYVLNLTQIDIPDQDSIRSWIDNRQTLYGTQTRGN